MKLATCYQRHPFEVQTEEDHLTTINTQIFEIKKKIQLSEGQRKSHYEEGEAERQQNAQLIAALKKEVRERLRDLAGARKVVGDEEARVRKYLNQLYPLADKTAEQIIHGLDLKVTEQRKNLDLARYERKHKRIRLKKLEKEYEELLILQAKYALESSKITNPVKKQASHLENEIHRVTVQGNEAELIKKKYCTIREALSMDAVKFESSLTQIQEMLKKQQTEIRKLQSVRDEAVYMRGRATAALAAEQARLGEAAHARLQERAYFTQRFEQQARELEALEKRLFPQTVRPAVRPDSAASGDLAAEEAQADSRATMVDEIFRKLTMATGVTEAELVLERMRSQKETSRRLQYLQKSTEKDKLALEKAQTNLIAELEAFKFAEVKDKDEGQEQIEELKVLIDKEVIFNRELTEKLHTTNSLLMEIKRYLFDFCRMLESADERGPQWTQEPRDVTPALESLQARFAAAAARAAHALLHNADAVMAAIAAGPQPRRRASDTPALSARSSPRDDQPSLSVLTAAAALPTYAELVAREPAKPTVSDEEEDIPSRSYLKRQAQLIVDTKSRRKGYRPQYRK